MDYGNDIKISQKSSPSLARVTGTHELGIIDGNKHKLTHISFKKLQKMMTKILRVI